MKVKNYIYLICAALLSVSCNNFEDINTNSDSSTKVTSSLLATGAIMSITRPSSGEGFIYHMFTTKYMALGATLNPEVYNSFGKESFNGYTTIRNCQLMAEQAAAGEKNAYKALYLFIKSYILFSYTHNVGDIPYTDILKGKEGVFKPTYTPQQDVIKGILSELDESYNLFSTAKNFAGDPLLNGDVKKWAKIVSAFQMRILVELSKKENDNSLNIKQRFNDIYKNRMLLESNKDNLQVIFSDKAGQIYPFHNSINKAWEYPMLSSVLIDILKKHNDFRLFYYASPAQAEIDKGLSDDSWDAYYGISIIQPFENIKSNFVNKQYCTLNKRYTQYIVGEPYILIGYAEQNFLLAEAALRGWISEKPETFYKEGIKSNMSSISSNTPDNRDYHHGRKITEDVIEKFINSETITLTGDFEKDLEKILNQKYVASFMQTPYLSYYDYRRTGYPIFPINPNTNMNFKEPNKIPVRWLYPDIEFAFNKENVEKALRSQFGGIDEVNKVMWLLK